MLIKKLKTAAGSLLINQLGQTLDSTSYYELQEVDEKIWMNDEQTLAAITGGSIIVNDGNADLSAVEGLKWFKSLEEASNIVLGSNYENLPSLSAKEAVESVALTGKGTALELKNIELQEMHGTEYTQDLLDDISSIDVGASSGYVAESGHLKVGDTGTMTVVSKSFDLASQPSEAMLVTEEMLITGGTVTYFVSVDNGTTWTTIANLGVMSSIVSNLGLKARMKCIMTGKGSCLKGYGLHFEVEIL